MEPGEIPDDRTEPQPADDGCGQSEAGADGIVPLDVLVAAGRYCEEHRNEVAYTDVYDMVGYVHGAPLTGQADWKPGETHIYQWSANTGEYIDITFTAADNGYEYWKSMSGALGIFTYDWSR